MFRHASHGIILLTLFIALFVGCKKRNECEPTITKQPASPTIKKGQSVTLTVEANVNGNIGYKWYEAAPTGSIPLSSDTNRVTVTPANTTTYFVWVYGACGEKRGQKISDSAVVKVQP